MTAMDNTGLLTLTHYSAPGIAPVVAYAYDAEDEEITVTNSSTFGAGDSFKAVIITVTDCNGKQVHAKISVAATPNVINVSTLDAYGGFNILAQVISTKREQAILTAYGVGATLAASGNLRHKNISHG